MDPQLQKWVRWLGDVSVSAADREAGIVKEITDLCVNRHLFGAVAQMIRDNPKIQRGSVFYDMFGYCYAHAMMSGIRRHVKIDTSGQSKSLATLLHEIVERHRNPTRESKVVLTRDCFVSFYTTTYKEPPELAEHMKRMGEATFDNTFAGNVGDYVDPALVEQDLIELRTRACRCEEYVDRRVAHLDKRPPSSIPTYDEIDDCVGLMDHLVSKYEMLLTGSSPETAMPVLDPEWDEIFKVPWILENRSI